MTMLSVDIEADVAAAVGGDRVALERVVRGIQPLVSRLALRFFACPDYAADATQEALVHIVTKLDRFGGDSAFSTWLYRVVANKLMSMKRSRVEKLALSFASFDEELARTPDGPPPALPDADHSLLLEEVKIGCTLAMLVCLERDARMAYILGEISELDHEAAAAILGIDPAAFRKRVQRARDAITQLMRARCGLFDAHNACRCEKRVPIAIGLGRLDPKALLYASSREQAQRFPEVLVRIRRIEEVKRAAALYRSHPDPIARADLAAQLKATLDAASDGMATDDR